MEQKKAKVWQFRKERAHWMMMLELIWLSLDAATTYLIQFDNSHIFIFILDVRRMPHIIYIYTVAVNVKQCSCRIKLKGIFYVVARRKENTTYDAK